LGDRSHLAGDAGKTNRALPRGAGKFIHRGRLADAR
jgi:hypothetical protein